MEPTTKTKKRAFRACVPCRARKVRCIVTETCQPCMNCKLDEKECDFARRPSIPPKYPRGCQPGLNNADTQSDASASELAPSSARGRSPRAPDNVGGNTLKRRCAGDGIQGQDCNQTSGSNQVSKEMAGLLYDPTNPAYSFLQAPKTKTILPQDLEFLYNQGCFSVPERHVLDEFMKQYFSFIHPILPILNEADFWAMYNSKDTEATNEDRISIIVLQGMLFTSATFVSHEIRQSLGFKTTQDAKYSFYRRAKLLYDFGYERSSIPVAQAAVLLSHSHLIPLPYGGFKQLGSLWAGIAIHHARDARAHRYYMMTPSNPPSPKDLKHYNTLKRLWWCCIVSDRVIPLTSRQNIKITRTNFNFDGSPALSIEDLAEENDCSEVYDSTTKRLLAQVTVKIVELCVVLTDVLTLSALVHENPSWGISSRLAETNQAGICRIRLQRWYQTFLSMKSAMGKMTVDNSGAKSSRSSVILFTNLAEMYYHSARLNLCHYEMLHLGQAALTLTPLFDTTDMTQKTYELQNATSQVTECLAELTRLGLIRWLPMSAVGCTAFPLALQILDAELFQKKLGGISPSKTSAPFSDYQRERLNILVEAMKVYRPRYCMADWITQTVKFIVNATHNWLPSKPMEPGSSKLSVASWIEILQLQPTYYLRLALTMDLSISNGKLPDDDDFPPGLRQAWHGRITATVSPEFIPMNFGGFFGPGMSASEPSRMPQRLLESTGETLDNSTPYVGGEPSSELPIEQIDLPEEPANKPDTFDSAFPALANCPDVLAPQSNTANENFLNTFSPANFGEDIFSFNPEIPFPVFPSQTFDFSMGGSYSIHNSLSPLGKGQWANGESDINPDEAQQRINDSFLESLREATSRSFRTNGERLLEELNRAINLP